MTPCRILIVEDDTMIRGFLCDALEMQGFTIETVSDGAEAIARLAEGQPDLVLTDVYMPNMNGVDLSRQVVTEHPGLPVVLMTGMASDDEKMLLRNSGACAILRKPIRIQKLFEVLNEAARSGRDPSP